MRVLKPEFSLLAKTSTPRGMVYLSSKDCMAIKLQRYLQHGCCSLFTNYIITKLVYRLQKQWLLISLSQAAPLSFFIFLTNPLVIFTLKCGLLSAKASNLGEEVMSSAFLRIQFKAVFCKGWLQQTSASPSTSRALVEFKDLIK